MLNTGSIYVLVILPVQLLQHIFLTPVNKSSYRTFTVTMGRARMCSVALRRNFSSVMRDTREPFCPGAFSVHWWQLPSLSLTWHLESPLPYLRVINHPCTCVLASYLSDKTGSFILSCAKQSHNVCGGDTAVRQHACSEVFRKGNGKI